MLLHKHTCILHSKLTTNSKTIFALSTLDELGAAICPYNRVVLFSEVDLIVVDLSIAYCIHVLAS